ncbi:helix-turn-helix domain-containing protein [Carboxydothermus hydrogenoformans]|uniref:Putative prophage LambdaCh01, transcriptional regulator n=1 Tax=Carboxydothermus hydrogenoformans (strain ATCC BAA-161 / DSM 6008 / Z-2901) TaxID=246194 RepID=Q3ABH0_CARHZ|nr:helix-turn-helix transcriptional regulator [Carboxydothermus hydrogenoformans]ABB14410.1 putative prophage LambdaCh01, transcriptional regulator [Carboxydothermus hydrogenoformans Z-2901]
MKGDCSNIYKIARKNAGLTQEEAAEMLYVSVRSLADYESGKTIPPDDVVERMIEIYDAKYLAYMHLKNSTKIGRRYLPDISLNDISRAVLKLQKELNDVEKINPEIIEIICDGEIDEDEKPRWQRITKEINEMAGAALTVVFSG